MKLWNWFPAIYFHLQPISFWMMLGCIFAISVHKTVDHTKDRKTDWQIFFLGTLLGPLFILGLGYLIHLKIS